MESVVQEKVKPDDVGAAVGKLFKPCDHCDKPRKLVEQLAGMMHHVQVFTSTTSTHQAGQDDTVRKLVRPLKVHCEFCLDSGVYPTPYGWLVLSFVKTFLDAARLDALKDQVEIPF